MNKGLIFNIQRFSLHDGPGIRTNVFFKGCPLRCVWCHNPEGLEKKFEIEFNGSKCIGCGRCSVCPEGCHVFGEEGHVFNRTACTTCGKCVEACVAGSLKMAGKEYTVEEVLSVVETDMMFYSESGGGMTISGGEPLFQAEFAIELLKAAKERNIHTAIETSGFCSEETMKRAAPYIDLFLYDYKATGEEEHVKATGVSQKPILRNLELVNGMGKEIVLRCPIIPSINDNNVHFDAIASLAEKYSGVIRVDIEPYHDLGTSKYPHFDKTAKFTSKMMETDKIEQIREYIQSKTKKRVVVS